MASSCRIFREELLARPVSLLLGALGGSRDPARATSLWTATLGRGSRLRDEPDEELPAQQWRRLDRRAYP
jgi:hypothetical protein